jgi:phosphate/sulfate permease
MSTIFLILVFVLALLAVSDLVVGVSNDAVNFLNSALGSKAFKFKVIMFIAALGILFGATFSSGMMEVARKGIFHPQYFYFSEIIILFLAVMITDVILLDMFNTFGMPTSTTVSIVFELLGAAVGVAFIKVLHDPESLPLGEYINSSKAMVIILGILLSVVIAFTAGAIVQYFSRLLFSFNYKNRQKYFGAIFGGIAITAITYFILVKGAKGASFMTDEMKDMIKNSALLIMLVSFVFWALVLQLFQLFTKLDIFKIIVLFGTFALAMAFAGNDLVNFIGVPLAGYESYKIWLASGEAADSFLMSGLAGKVATPTLFLLLAGIIMAVTLYLSRKARSVTETEINLGRQEEGYERFGSSALSRSLVRSFSKTGRYMMNVIPAPVQSRINKQFDRTSFQARQIELGKDAPAFDLLRASVILSVASIIISIATFLKLPLSTTYVTFMVAMGASLADGAWGRESAVYRITGVLSVIGGWFLTAFFAFTAAFLLALLFHYGSFYAIFAMIAIVAFIIFRTHIFHRKRTEAIEKDKEAYEVLVKQQLTAEDVRDINTKAFTKAGDKVDELLNKSIHGLKEEDLLVLSKNYKKFKKFNDDIKDQEGKLSHLITKLADKDLEVGNYYTLNLYYLLEINNAIRHITWDTFYHVDNNHKPLKTMQIDELMEAKEKVMGILNNYINRISGEEYKDYEKMHNEVVNLLRKFRKNQIKRIQSKEVGTRNSVLFLGIITHFRTMINFTKRLHVIESNYLSGDHTELFEENK